VFDGVAFSLARGHTATGLSFAIGLSQHGVRWGDPKASTVFVVVLFAIPTSADRAYPSVIMTFSTLLKDKTLFSKLRQSKHPEEMFEILTRASMGETVHD
jgi:mannitol/fructose-specific phosphotransferase system IIA component (Ntr-type)